MSNIPTAHISSAKGDFARTVLMPGDPLRSKFIAENFLKNARLVNNVLDFSTSSQRRPSQKMSSPSLFALIWHRIVTVECCCVGVLACTSHR